MATHHAELELPYPPRQVFDLVADFESYPKFLSHVAYARILRRQDNTLFCEQVFRIGPMRFRFRTQTQLDPPHSIHVVCADSPFGSFDDRWTFGAGAHGGTRISCRHCIPDSRRPAAAPDRQGFRRGVQRHHPCL